MIIEIRPKQDGKWHGQKGAKSFSRPVDWPAPVDPRTRLYDVDINEEDRKILENTNYDISIVPKWDSNGRLLPHPTWDTQIGRLKLPRMNTLVLDTDNIIDKIKYAVVKRCPLIAPSEEEVGTANYPEAEFYIYSEQLSIASKEKDVALRRNAGKLSYEMTLDDKKNIIWILKGVDVTGRREGFVDVLIEELVEEDPAAFVEYGTMDKEKFTTMGLIHEAVFKGILIKDGMTIKWGSEIIGHSINDAVEYLNDPKNQPVLVRIMDKLNK